MTPELVTAVFDAFREYAAAGEPAAVEVHDAFLAKLRPWLAFSEWASLGEQLDDGIADSNANGVPEPSLAGGPHGRAPVFAAELLEGPAAAPGNQNQAITWSEHILPLFRAKCAQCHLDGAQRGRYRLDTPTLAQVPGESGGLQPLVVPGDPEASLLYRKLVDRAPPVGVQMPEALPPLSATGKDLVRRWIEQGATAR